MTKIPYSKKALSATDQVNLLKSRGLVIINESSAENILKHINYYRLSAYIYPFLIDKETEHEGKSKIKSVSMIKPLNTNWTKETFHL